MLGRLCGPNILPQVSQYVYQNRISTRAFSVEALHEQLKTRRLPLTFDYLSPQPSHLLNLTLRDILPEASTSSLQKSCSSNKLSSVLQPHRMSPGHHLVYFPPQVPISQLLADGTDVLHTPGPPFTRRLWGGGSVRFPSDIGPLLHCQRAVCVERIRDVFIKGAKGEEKIVVGIERQIFEVEENETEERIQERLVDNSLNHASIPHIIEMRNLVFLRNSKMDSNSTVAQTPGTRYLKRMYSSPWI